VRHTHSKICSDVWVVANLPKGAYFKNYLRNGVCFKRNNGGGLLLGGTRHCHWRQRWREESIATGSGEIGHVGGREESVANANGDTPPAEPPSGLAIQSTWDSPTRLARQPGSRPQDWRDTPSPIPLFVFVLAGQSCYFILFYQLGHC